MWPGTNKEFHTPEYQPLNEFPVRLVHTSRFQSRGPVASYIAETLFMDDAEEGQEYRDKKSSWKRSKSQSASFPKADGRTEFQTSALLDGGYFPSGVYFLMITDPLNNAFLTHHYYFDCKKSAFIPFNANGQTWSLYLSGFYHHLHPLNPAFRLAGTRAHHSTQRGSFVPAKSVTLTCNPL